MTFPRDDQDISQTSFVEHIWRVPGLGHRCLGFSSIYEESLFSKTHKYIATKQQHSLHSAWPKGHMPINAGHPFIADKNARVHR